MKTKEIFNHIQSSHLFRINGHDINVTESLLDLCAAIESEDETDWQMGECSDFTLDQLIVAAFWAASHCHSGQNSDTFLLLSQLGEIFSPGMSDGPEEGTEEWVCDELSSALLAA